MLAFALLTVSVVLGLALSGRVHRFVGMLAGAFVGIHLAGLLADTYVPFSLSQVLVPFTSSYRPLATGLGVVSLELLAALAVVNRYRKRLPYRFWRRAHYLNFAVWALALAHGIASGTDSGTPWGVLLYGVAAGSVAGLLAWRAAGGGVVAAADAR
jgi:predicted ferric reductase